MLAPINARIFHLPSVDINLNDTPGDNERSRERVPCGHVCPELIIASWTYGDDNGLLSKCKRGQESKFLFVVLYSRLGSRVMVMLGLEPFVHCWTYAMGSKCSWTASRPWCSRDTPTGASVLSDTAARCRAGSVTGRISRSSPTLRVISLSCSKRIFGVPAHAFCARCASTPSDHMVYQLKYDSVHGRCNALKRVSICRPISSSTTPYGSCTGSAVRSCCEICHHWLPPFVIQPALVQQTSFVKGAT